MSKKYFRFSPDILRRLGEELIPSPEQGIIELVKNSYDADAQKCLVKLSETDAEGGTVIISDDGIGMDFDSIIDGWLVIGRSKKASVRKPTHKFGRLPVGDKGLGRLAALRQGSQVILATRPERECGVEYRVVINWSDFEKVDVVEDVPFEIEKRASDKEPGTDIIINDLQLELGKREIQKLARELLLLADPFDNRFGFFPELIAPGFVELERRVKEAYFEDAEYHLKACLNEKGFAEAWLLDWKGNVQFHANQRDISKRPYKTAAAEFEMWTFLLNQGTFSTRKSSIKEVREWLSVVGGVHLYHRGLRVRPYGDQGHDWLEMNLARARSPEERPSTNTTIGRVMVDDPDDLLVQKTDRIGFIEDETFSELRRFAIDALNWMARMRLKEAEKRREKERQKAPQGVELAKTKLDDVIVNKVPEDSQQIVKKTVRQYERSVERSIKTLREDLQLYRSLATAGTTSAVFAHEMGKTITLIKKIAQTIEYRSRNLLGEQYVDTLEKSVKMLYRTSDALQSFAKLPLHLLQREKRRSGVVEIHTTIDDIIEVFQPFLEDAKITLIKEKVDGNPQVHGSIALLEAIITNLLTNVINAFNVEGARSEKRNVIIRTEFSSNRLLLKILDNGPGITDLKLDEIWLPGRTTTPGGTGFGLTIVKDSVADLSGKVYAIANGELGGAEFIVELPLIGV